MKTYATDLDHQGLLTAYEKAKAVFKTAKAENKALKTLIKTSMKEENVAPDIVTSNFQYKQAKLKEKVLKIKVYIAKLSLQEWAESFRMQKKQAPKIEGIETALLKYRFEKRPLIVKNKRVEKAPNDFAQQKDNRLNPLSATPAGRVQKMA